MDADFQDVGRINSNDMKSKALQIFRERSDYLTARAFVDDCHHEGQLICDIAKNISGRTQIQW